MIIADTNVIAYLFIEGDCTAKAKELLKFDPIWLSPFLWRSEFRNVLRLYICQNYLSVEDAQNIMNEAEKFMKGNEYEVNSFEVLELASQSQCSAYDCEYVALAKQLKLDLLYTSDKKILNKFPDIASSLKDFVCNDGRLR
jgi:predicted nucleic acid-binding protein